MAGPKKVQRRVLMEIAQSVREGGGSQPQLSTLVQHFFDVAGGERAVAKMLYDEMKSPLCSPHVRSRILEMVLRSVEFANRQLGTKADMADLSDEDLEHEVLKVVAEIEESNSAPTQAG